MNSKKMIQYTKNGSFGHDKKSNRDKAVEINIQRKIQIHAQYVKKYIYQIFIIVSFVSNKRTY